MMTRLRLGIDLDGVVCDFTADWKRCYRAEFGEPGTKSTWDGFSTITHFDSEGEFWDWLSTTRCWEDPVIIDDAVTALQELAEEHELYVISSKPEWAINRTMLWLASLGVPWRGIVIGSMRKSNIDCDVYVDDGPHNLEDFLLNRPSATTVRMIRPWNSEFDGHPGMLHVNDLFELGRVLQQRTRSAEGILVHSQ